MDILDMVYAVTGLLISAGFGLVLLAFASLYGYRKRSPIPYENIRSEK